MKMLVTGGGGFIGAALVSELIASGQEVRVLDNFSRGHPERLAGYLSQLDLVQGDVRDPSVVRRAAEGCEVLWHLAYINGTQHFYETPEVVLDVGIKGALNTLEAALEAGVRRYVLASSSEVYNVPTHLPTSEVERLMIPDVTNPRFSYGGGKIASELLALHYGAPRGLETIIFRPHNIYGPDMGFEHVIPEVIGKIIRLSAGLTRRRIDLPIQGDGSETRAFCYISDAARGAYLAGMRGEAGQIYHLGTEVEISVRSLIHKIADLMGIEVNIVPGALREGSTPRRCPSIGKLQRLGYVPLVTLDEGLAHTVTWYQEFFLRSATVSAEHVA